MKTLAPLLVAALVAPPVAYATQSWHASNARTELSSTTDAISAQAEDTTADAARIAAQLADIESRLETLAKMARARSSVGERESIGGLADAISAALEQRGMRIAPGALQASQADRAQARADLFSHIDACLANDDPLAFAENWRRLADEGLLDVAIAELLRRSEEDPTDINAAEDLARAATAAMDSLRYGPRSVRFGYTADEAYLRGLNADPERDDLRLARAQNLARLPSVLGRRGEAIAELETVILAGETGSQADPQSYSLLGTLLLEQGSVQQALDAWQRGAGAFPDDKDLQRLLELHAKQ